MLGNGCAGNLCHRASTQEMEWLQRARLEAHSAQKEGAQGSASWCFNWGLQDPFRDLLRRQVFERVAGLEPAGRRIPAGPLKGSAGACAEKSEGAPK